ncbi:MAG: M48 family metalloprotease [Pseudomonadota bacterium]
MKRIVAAIAAAILLAAQPAVAQSILRDAETEAMLNDMSRPLILAAGLSPRNVRIVLINDDEINAFVAGSQTVYIHSGLIQAADTANEVQGVIAHELGHVADGHIPLQDVGVKPAIGITILSMVLGVAAAAAGSADAAAGIFAAGQQAALGKFLAFSRTTEASADAAAVRYLDTAGVSGRGMISFFKKLQNQEFRYGVRNIDPFAQSHPLSGQRIATLTGDVTKSKSYLKPFDAALEVQFKRVKAKLTGYIARPETTLNLYPETDTSVYARYARAYAWHKRGYPERADAEVAGLLKADPADPYFLEIKGQILLESGKPVDSLVPLRRATEETRYSPLIATTFGHALIATENPANYAEAERVLRQAVARDDQNPFAWYQLGTVYELKGDEARVALATAERSALNGNDRAAAVSARRAMIGLTPNTPDWIRAQDIALTSGFAADEARRKKR